MRRFMRYTLVGAVATAVHYALLALVVELGHWPAWLGSGLGAVVGAQVAFFGNRGFTFGHAGDIAPAWVKFMGTALVGAVFGMLVVAQMLATLLSLVLTFAINRAWTFR
jgi:putative flippase GtrA